jgi:hypothetical protein
MSRECEKCPACGGKWPECNCAKEHYEMVKDMGLLRKFMISQGWNTRRAKSVCLNLCMEVCAELKQPVHEVKEALEKFLKMYALNLARIQDENER